MVGVLCFSPFTPTETETETETRTLELELELKPYRCRFTTDLLNRQSACGGVGFSSTSSLGFGQST